MSLRKSLCKLVPLDLPNFQTTAGAGFARQRSFSDVNATVWYEEFKSRIHRAIGKEFLPIYRMADGEFIFCVGERMYRPHGAVLDKRVIWRTLRGAVRKVINRRSEQALLTCWGENYRVEERIRLLPDYILYLRRIAEKGILAIHFVEMSNSVFGTEYFVPVCDWFDEHKITLNAENYASFYFVYALLAEAHLNGLFTGLTVAVVTHVSEARVRGIERGLRELGANKVIFLPISESQAMTDRIPGPDCCEGFDLALVGAGVGAANILCQLERYATVCIDAGFFLETLIEPGRRGERLFTRTDQEKTVCLDGVPRYADCTVMPPPLQRYAATCEEVLQSNPATRSARFLQPATGGIRSCSKADLHYDFSGG